ncbi:hypothetical protein HUK83_16270, partial [Endobacter medicaginis]|nr:hypothetical protein [Endobacter medicaginis]
GWGGWGGGWGPGWGGGFGGIPPMAYTSTCTTTFEIDSGKVASWKLRGDGC